MPFGSYRGLLCCLVLAGLALASPASAQIYPSDNVVLLSHRDEFSGYSDIWGFVGNNGREYVILQTITGSAWYDVQDPIHPVLIKEIPGAVSSWRDAFDIGNYVYLGSEGGGGIQIVDVSNPANPTLVGAYTATVNNSHTVFGDRARKLVYVMGGFADGAAGGLQVLNAANPTNLVEVGRWTNQYVHDASAEGNIVHANLINVGRFRLIDTTNPASPAGLGNAFNDPTGATHSSWPFGDGIHVLVTEETIEAVDTGRLKCLNISNPATITLVDDYNPAPNTSAHNPHIQGNRAAVSWYTRGTRLIDITNPANLAEIGYVDTYPTNDGPNFAGNWGTFPHFPSGLIASSDISGGLFLFKYEPNAGTLNGTVSSSTGGFLSGATAEYTNLGLTQVTAANGLYQFACYPGSGNKIRFSCFGFQSDSINVAVAPNGTTTTNVTLTKLPSGAIQGTARDAGTSLPIELVELSLVGTPLKTTTAANGFYSFPDVPSGSYQLQVLRYGYLVPGNIPVTVTTGNTLTRDINLHAA
ncbi:MAG TPA: choice-of-anchor B family protein, partial [bacterium]|nr:choice-of-anchor B family protein [bacterium]